MSNQKRIGLEETTKASPKRASDHALMGGSLN